MRKHPNNQNQNGCRKYQNHCAISSANNFYHASSNKVRRVLNLKTLFGYITDIFHIQVLFGIVCRQSKNMQYV